MNAVDLLPADPAVEPEAPATDGAFAQAEQANREAQRRRRAYWIVGCGAVGVAILLIAVSVFVERTSFYTPVIALNERLVAEGLPTTWDEIQADAPHPPAELDGTAEWLAFLKKYRRVDAFDPLDSEASEATAAPWIEELRALAASGKYRDALYPASVMVEGDYYSVLLDELSIEYFLGQFLVARAKSQFGKCDADGAAESIALALTLAANTKYEPFLVCRLNGAAQFNYAAEVLEPLIEAGELSPQRLIQAQKALERCDVASRLESMRLHETLMRRDYATIGRLEGVTPLEKLVARHVVVRQIELSDRLRRDQALRPADRLTEFERIDEAFRRETESGAVRWTGSLESIVSAGSDNVSQELRLLETEARRRALIAAIACRRFEHERGTLPSDWADLADYGVAEPPLNPWSERPLTLRRTSDGNVTIEAPWIEEAIAAREARGSGDLEREPFEAIKLPPRTP